MLTDGRTDGRTTDGRTTDAGVTGILIAHLRAFGSGELKIQHKIAIIFLSYVWGAQKKRLNETVLLSTHNMFWLRNKKIFLVTHSYLGAWQNRRILF